jgi:hypothetical protein
MGKVGDRSCVLERKIIPKDFWVCWDQLYATGWHHFSWSRNPFVLRIALYHSWYTKEHLVAAFFSDFFSTIQRGDRTSQDFILECTMDLIEKMSPFNDLFADIFIDLSPQRFWHMVWFFFHTPLHNVSFLERAKIIIALVVTWPMSLTESYVKTAERIMEITNIIAK